MQQCQAAKDQLALFSSNEDADEAPSSRDHLELTGVAVVDCTYQIHAYTGNAWSYTGTDRCPGSRGAQTLLAVCSEALQQVLIAVDKTACCVQCLCKPAAQSRSADVCYSALHRFLSLCEQYGLLSKGRKAAARLDGQEPLDQNTKRQRQV